MKKRLTRDDVNNIAATFLKLKKLSVKDHSKLKEFESYKNFVVKELSFLVAAKAKRYKSFENYSDLFQEGLEALFLSLKTYKPGKGDFGWWARKYINTRITRSANRHSTIHIPINKVKDFKPFKTSKMPLLIDGKDSPSENFLNNEMLDRVYMALEMLEETEKNILTMAFGINGSKEQTITDISKKLNMSRQECVRLVKKAQKNLKTFLKTPANM